MRRGCWSDPGRCGLVCVHEKSSGGCWGRGPGFAGPDTVLGCVPGAVSVSLSCDDMACACCANGGLCAVRPRLRWGSADQGVTKLDHEDVARGPPTKTWRGPLTKGLRSLTTKTWQGPLTKGSRRASSSAG